MNKVQRAFRKKNNRCKGTEALTVSVPLSLVLHHASVKHVGGEEDGSWDEKGTRRQVEVGRARK